MKPEFTAFVFPGQGSQAVGMGQQLAETYSSARDIFDQADQILGYPLSGIAWNGPEESLNDTINTQPALFVHSVAALRVFEELYPGFLPAYTAGHSMGELSALVAVGSLSFTDGLRLVRVRGEAMKSAGELSPGGMAAILGLDITAIEQICSQASDKDEIVQVANDNCPGQIVISGANAALDRAMILLQQAGAKRTIRLAVSIAAHSPLMTHAQSVFNQAVASAPISNPHKPIIGNVTASPLVNSQDIRQDLQDQLTKRVRWTESIQRMIAFGVTNFIELGSGSVLNNLIKRIDRQVAIYSLGKPEDFDKFSPEE